MTKIFNIAHQNGFMYMVDPNEVWKTVASNNPELNNLPKLPPVEEDVEKLALKHFPEYIGNNTDIQKQISKRIGFTEGYKAASKKKYTEEDIMTFYKHVKTHTFQEAIDHLNKSLNPLPKQVEVEMELGESCHCSNVGYTLGDGGCAERNRCTVIPEEIDGFITVKRWIYE